MNPINNLFTSTFIQSLGWTILHSLWQIAIVSVIYGIVLYFLKRNSSANRYYLSATFLLVILFISIITFYNEYSIYNKEVITAQTDVFENLSVEFADIQTIGLSSDSQLTVKEKFINYIDNHLSLIVAIWNLSIFFMLVKMLGGLVYAQRLKNYKTLIVPEQWREKLDQLSKSIGLDRNIQLLESAIVKVPMVIGFFKPVILLPLGIISGLSTEQLEAILAHELAHIKRNDYLVNVIQIIIEILFFYHPAIWWISKNIRDERENACDDIAISINKNGIALAKALANLEILNHNKYKYAMAINGNKSSLINRVLRIANQQKTSFTLKEGISTACILIASLIIMSFSTHAIIKEDGKQNVSEKNELQIENGSKSNLNELASNSSSNGVTIQSNISLDTIKTQASIEDTIILINQDKEIMYMINGIYYRLNLGIDKKLEKFSINEKEIPKSEWNKHQNFIDEALSHLNEYRNVLVDDEELRYQSEVLKLQAEILKNQSEKLKLQADELKLQSERLKAQNEKLDKEFFEFNLRDKESIDSIMKLQPEEIKQKEIEFYHGGKKLVDKRVKLMEQQALINIERTKLGEQKKKFNIENEKLKKQEQLLKEQENQKNQKEKEKIFNELVEEMKNDKLIDTSEIAYKVHFYESYLEINEERQSNEVFQKYKHLFDEKSKGRFELDYQLNVNPNFFKKKDELKK